MKLNSKGHDSGTVAFWQDLSRFTHFGFSSFNDGVGILPVRKERHVDGLRLRALEHVTQVRRVPAESQRLWVLQERRRLQVCDLHSRLLFRGELLWLRHCDAVTRANCENGPKEVNSLPVIQFGSVANTVHSRQYENVLLHRVRTGLHTY